MHGAAIRAEPVDKRLDVVEMVPASAR